MIQRLRNVVKIRSTYFLNRSALSFPFKKEVRDVRKEKEARPRGSGVASLTHEDRRIEMTGTYLYSSNQRTLFLPFEEETEEEKNTEGEKEARPECLWCDFSVSTCCVCSYLPR